MFIESILRSTQPMAKGGKRWHDLAIQGCDFDYSEGRYDKIPLYLASIDTSSTTKTGHFAFTHSYLVFLAFPIPHPTSQGTRKIYMITRNQSPPLHLPPPSYPPPNPPPPVLPHPSRVHHLHLLPQPNKPTPLIPPLPPPLLATTPSRPPPPSPSPYPPIPRARPLRPQAPYAPPTPSAAQSLPRRPLQGRRRCRRVAARGGAGYGRSRRGW